MDLKSAVDKICGVIHYVNSVDCPFRGMGCRMKSVLDAELDVCSVNISLDSTRHFSQLQGSPVSSSVT